MFTLKEVEADIDKSFGGPKGTVDSGTIAAAEKLLHKEAYSKEELEESLGVRLENLFAGNASQLKSVAFASQNGELPKLLRTCQVSVVALGCSRQCHSTN